MKLSILCPKQEWQPHQGEFDNSIFCKSKSPSSNLIVRNKTIMPVNNGEYGILAHSSDFFVYKCITHLYLKNNSIKHF